MGYDPWPRALRIRPCLCGHDQMDHSKILLGEPCLDCDCPGFMTIWREKPVKKDTLVTDPLLPDWISLQELADELASLEAQDLDVAAAAKRLDIALSRDPGLRASREERKRLRDEARRDWSR